MLRRGTPVALAIAISFAYAPRLYADVKVTVCYKEGKRRIPLPEGLLRHVSYRIATYPKLTKTSVKRSRYLVAPTPIGSSTFKINETGLKTNENRAAVIVKMQLPKGGGAFEGGLELKLENTKKGWIPKMAKIVLERQPSGVRPPK